MTHFDG